MTKQTITPRGRNEGHKRASTRSAGSRRSTPQGTTSSRRKSTRSTPKPKTTANIQPQSSRLPRFMKALLEDPNALRNLRHHLPSWTDELFAALLIGIGAVAFASLLSSGGEGELSGRISEMLRHGFGNGAYVVSLGVLCAGLFVLLPKTGIQISFSWGRLIALELTFVCLQGLLHALAFEREGEALARQGGGGGYVGWAVNNFFVRLVDEPFNIVIFGGVLFFSIQWLLGIKRAHYGQAVASLSQQIYHLADRLEQEPIPEVEQPIPEKPVQPASTITAPVTDTPAPEANAVEALPQKPSLIPSRPSLVPRSEPPKPMPEPRRAPRPPSNRGRTAPPLETRTAAAAVSTPTVKAAAAPEPESVPKEPTPPSSLDTSERPALIVNGQEVGDLTPLVKERQSIVPRTSTERPQPAVMSPPSKIKRRHKGGRDDDPDKRYFQVTDFSETKKIGRRADILPPLELLNGYELVKPDEEEINRNASIIENTLLEFDIDADVIDVKVGPVVTQYALSPIKEVRNLDTGELEINRVRVDRITSLQGDLALALSAKTLRIEAPVPGHSYVGIEVPNRNPSTVGLRPVLESETYYRQNKTPLSIPLGRDVSGEPVTIDLGSLPHLLVAGTTGSGKSVFLASVITSLVMNNTHDMVKMIMLDPKRVELTRFNGIPHLLGPVETEADRIIGVLRWTAREMDHRYKLMELENARNIDAYNAALGRRRKDEHLPYIVLLFDEIGDLMMSHPDETEGTVTRLAQKARAAGIHMIIATQRPSVDILTGLIKANFPGRLSFAVASGTDSRVILDYVGAETLLGRGDLLYLAPDAAGPRRIQGCYLSDEEVEEVVMYWKGWHEEQIAEGNMEQIRVAPWERGLTRLESLSEQDPLLEDAIQLVIEAKEASTSLIQRRLGIGYPRAARILDSMYELGIVGPPQTGGRARKVNIKTYKQAMKHMKK